MPELQGWERWLGVLSIPALVALNGFFVAAEFALVAVRRTRIEELAAQGVGGTQPVLAALKCLDQSIAATQLGITLASLGLGWVAEGALSSVFLGWFAGLPAPWQSFAGHGLAGTLAFLLITFLHVVLGELFPKTLALQAPDKVSLFVARPLLIFTFLTRPIIKVMNGAGIMLARICGFEFRPEAMVHSVEELELLVEDTEEAGILDPDQAELLYNVFAMATKRVQDCMVPRDEMAVLELSSSPDTILEAARTGAHTRMPVYAGRLDEIVGIVNTKDLFHQMSLKKTIRLDEAIYPPVFLPPDEEIANALRLFRRARKHMALVRDDEGRILGLLTLEDVLEEIIGDIEDEHDRPVPKLARLKLAKWLRRPTPKDK